MSNGQVFGVTGIRRRKRPIVPEFSYPLYALKREEEFRTKGLEQTERGLDIEAEQIRSNKELAELGFSLTDKYETARNALTRDIASKRNVLDTRLAGETAAFNQKQAKTANLYSGLNLAVTGATAAKELGVFDWDIWSDIGSGITSAIREITGWFD